jgi:isoquinoline 1-oxidoreductase subunit alpha
MQLNVNGHPRQVDVEADAPLLWVIRDELNLTGTKFGCGVGACGACTVHVNGKPMRSCVLPVSAVVDAQITTIEGIGAEGPSAVQAAWISHQVPQCGYCQSGVIMAVSALLASNPMPTEDELGTLITNICRCGTYTRMRAAVSSLVASGARK